MKKASTELLEQGTQTPSPAPDLIPAETKNQPRTHIGIGTVNGGTSLPWLWQPEKAVQCDANWCDGLIRSSLVSLSRRA